MDVYLLETIYGYDVYCEILFHLKDTDIWLSDVSYRNDGSQIEHISFTQKFFDELGIDDKLTKLGRL